VTGRARAPWCGHGPACGLAVATAHLAGALDGEHLDLCWRHLNLFLDCADRYPAIEPARLVFHSRPRDAVSWWGHDPADSPHPYHGIPTSA
jgi:hypothetical protein